MDIASQVEVENELRSFGLDRLTQERTDINKQLKIIQDKIGDLAFDNYRTYVDAGRTAEDCTDIFTEISEKLREVSQEVPKLQNEVKAFYSCSKTIDDELRVVKSASEKNSPLWEILSLPSRMDLCIRSGYYDAAYSLTNYGMLMQQHSMVSNHLLKRIADRLVDARSLLLEELFNKFAGPLDLATSLQVVNNVRKMPYLTSTQLRVSILHHKDLYLEKQLIDIATHPDYALMAVDIYRTCMHDTLVLYLSVFPENESVKKDPSIDPRWEPWPTSAPSAILGQWANRNIQRLLDLVHRAEMKSGVDMASVWSKMMAVAATFGRLGLDFRPLVIQSLSELVLERFRTAVKQSTNRLVNEVGALVVMPGDIAPLPSNLAENEAPLPSSDISLWDDLCVYGNGILEALNGMRYSHTSLLLSSVVSILKESLKLVLSWISSFYASPNFAKAVKIFCTSFAPFLSQTIQYLFPYSVVSHLFGSTFTQEQYISFAEFDMRELVASCDGSDKIEEVILPLIQKKTLVDIDLDAVMRKKRADSYKENTLSSVESNSKPAAVFQSVPHSENDHQALEQPSPIPSQHGNDPFVIEQEIPSLVVEVPSPAYADTHAELEIRSNLDNVPFHTSPEVPSLDSEVPALSERADAQLDESTVEIPAETTLSPKISPLIPNHIVADVETVPSGSLSVTPTIATEESNNISESAAPVQLGEPDMNNVDTINELEETPEEESNNEEAGWGNDEEDWGWNNDAAETAPDVPTVITEKVLKKTKKDD